ncbi:MAG: hypothetical protein ACK4Q5_01845 [Saprospiraceae bacterium]
MTIERIADEIVIRVPASLDIERVQQFLNYLTYKELVAESRATQEDIDQLARDVNKSWWAKNKHKYLPET